MLVRELLMTFCTKASGNFLPPLARSQQKVMAMNLGLEKALPPAGGLDAGNSAAPPPATASQGKAHPAAAVFGQLMAEALQQQAKGQGTGTPSRAQGEPGAAGANETVDGNAELAAAGSGESDAAAVSASDAPGASTDATPDHSSTLLGLPLWMPPQGGMPAVQQITVGPSLQAITGTTPPPDAHSLAAFARQQGLDTAAIAWLMNPVRAGSDLPVPGPNTPPPAATLAATPAALTLASVPASAAQPPGSLPTSLTASLAAMASATGAAPTAPLPIASASVPGLAGGPLTGAAALPDPSLGGAGMRGRGAAALLPEGLASVATGVAQGAGATTSAAPAGAPLTAGPAATLELLTPDGARPVFHAHSELGHVRWSQALAAAQANPQNPSGANVNAPSTSTAWAQISLDLSDLAGDSGTPDESANSPSQGGMGAQGSAAAVVGDGQGLHKAQALSFQARLAAQPAMASSQAAGSDQMLQLTEKMADAIGERMLRELEKGQLKLRLSLKPAHLGHIEVEMRLRAGELDATFAAPQAATRELLQDGLARLRDSLTQAGMDVANLDVKNGQNRQNGGDSTAGQRKSAPKAASSDTTDTTVASVESAPRPRRSDGWDVMV